MSVVVNMALSSTLVSAEIGSVVYAGQESGTRYVEGVQIRLRSGWSNCIHPNLHSIKSRTAASRPHRNLKKVFPGCIRSVPTSCEAKDTQEENNVTTTVSSVPESLITFVSKGPLLAKVGIAREEIPGQIAEWERLGRLLARQLEFDVDNLSDSDRLRIYHYYLPVYFWCQKQLQKHQAVSAGPVPPLIIGLSAPQGCGKTTVVESLEYLFNEAGNRFAGISIDDFYLKADDQIKLAAAFPDNKLFQVRGNAGTHELALGTETIQALRSLQEPGSSMKLPRYNKSARSGKGDRADPATWPTVEGPVDLVLFEGWMLGFEPIDPQNACAVDPHLEEVNQRLVDYSVWHQQIDCWMMIEVPDPSWVYQWRLQAEVAMKRQGKAGMSDEEVADFVSRYMPAYKAYLPGLYKFNPAFATSQHILRFKIDAMRSPSV